MSLAWPVIPEVPLPTGIPVPMATIASINRRAPSARGTQRLSQPTSGEPTAATIAATITGTTITAVREASRTKAYEQDCDSTSNHDISPTFQASRAR